MLGVSITQILAHQFNVDAVFEPVAFDNRPHVTEPGGTMAVGAPAGFGAGRLPVEADGVDRRGQLFNSGHGRLQIRCHLVEADGQNDLFRPETHGRHPVAGGVQVDQFAVHGQGIGAGNHDNPPSKPWRIGAVGLFRPEPGAKGLIIFTPGFWASASHNPISTRDMEPQRLTVRPPESWR